MTLLFSQYKSAWRAWLRYSWITTITTIATITIIFTLTLSLYSLFFLFYIIFAFKFLSLNYSGTLRIRHFEYIKCIYAKCEISIIINYIFITFFFAKDSAIMYFHNSMDKNTFKWQDNVRRRINDYETSYTLFRILKVCT